MSHLSDVFESTHGAAIGKIPLNNSQFPWQFTIFAVTLQLCNQHVRRNETQFYPGFNELFLPLLGPVKHELFAVCSETDDFHRATSEREKIHLLFQWSEMPSQ